jgi:hypothetical protein
LSWTLCGVLKLVISRQHGGDVLDNGVDGLQLACLVAVDGQHARLHGGESGGEIVSVEVYK